MIIDDLETKKVLLAALEEEQRRVDAIPSEVISVLLAYPVGERTRRLFGPYFQAHSALDKAIKHYRLSIASTQNAALVSRDGKGRFNKKK